VKINNHVTFENQASQTPKLAAGHASDCAGSGMRYLSAYVR